MTPFINDIKSFFYSFYEESDIYSQPRSVNLKEEYDRYAFVKHHSDQQETIDKLFKRTVKHGNNVISATACLQADEFNDDDLVALKALGFSTIDLDLDLSKGLVLEHPNLPGWYIKKSFSFSRDEEDNRVRIAKSVSESDFPFWMVPIDKIGHTIGILAPNDTIHPLRVFMLKRGRKWIKQLHLDHLKACKEYLYELPNEDPLKPLCRRILVISKKEEILPDEDNLHQWINLAKNHPDKVKTMASQICTFIKCTHLTDMHLTNAMQLLKDDPEIVIFPDGEPIGGLSEASEEEMTRCFNGYDPGFFPLLGLKTLQKSLKDDLVGHDLDFAGVVKLREIFEEAIAATADEIISERRWYYTKIVASILCPLLPLALLAVAIAQVCYNQLFNPLHFTIE